MDRYVLVIPDGEDIMAWCRSAATRAETGNHVVVVVSKETRRRATCWPGNTAVDIYGELTEDKPKQKKRRRGE